MQVKKETTKRNILLARAKIYNQKWQAKLEGKSFAVFQPVTVEGQRTEFESSMIRDLVDKIQHWNEKDSLNLEECNLHWKKVLGIWFVQEGSPVSPESV